MSIEDFVKTEHYRILKYMVYKVAYVSARIDMLKQLGFKIVYDAVLEHNSHKKGRLFLDKRKRLRMQISNVIMNTHCAYYAILDEK